MSTVRTIEFSRHAKRRIRLYHIPESVITGMIAEKDFENGRHEIVRDVAGFDLPIKVISEVDDDSIMVITAYPVKRKKI